MGGLKLYSTLPYKILEQHKAKFSLHLRLFEGEDGPRLIEEICIEFCIHLSHHLFEVMYSIKTFYFWISIMSG